MTDNLWGVLQDLKFRFQKPHICIHGGKREFFVCGLKENRRLPPTLPVRVHSVPEGV